MKLGRAPRPRDRGSSSQDRRLGGGVPVVSDDGRHPPLTDGGLGRLCARQISRLINADRGARRSRPVAILYWRDARTAHRGVTSFHTRATRHTGGVGC